MSKQQASNPPTATDSDIESMFGNLGDGMQATTDSSPEMLQILRGQWQRRRNLAELIHRPEGFIFPLLGVSNSEDDVVLLTPPDRIAVQRSDGTWIRATRVLGETSTQPPPYTRQWYREYLRLSSLPQWFFSPEHLAMIENDAEADVLGMPNTPSGIFRDVPSRNYLDLQYANHPHQIASQILGRGEYRINLSNLVLERMQRRFPALGVAGPAGTLESDALSLPSSHVQLRSRSPRDTLHPPLPLASESQLRFTREGARVGPASYEIETQDNASLPTPLNVNGELCDPTNSKIHDGQNQTGGASASYHSREFPYRGIITVDRSVATVGKVEEHKQWSVTASGLFRKRESDKPIDWDDPASISLLNRWRIGAFTRDGWPKLRAEKRPDYTPEQRKWAMGYVEKADGGKLDIDMDEFADRYTAQFGPGRDKSGLGGLLNRLKTEYNSRKGNKPQTPGDIHSKD